MAGDTAAELKIIISTSVAKAEEDLRAVGEDAQKMAEELRTSGTVSKEAIDGIKRSIQELKADMNDMKYKVLQVHLDDLQAKAGLDELKTDMADMKDATVSVKVDDGEAKAQIDDVRLKIAQLKEDAKLQAAKIKVEADTAKADADLIAFKKLLETLPKDKNVRINVEKRTVDMGVPDGAAQGGGGLAGALIASAIPAASPLGATAIAGGMGLASALTPAAAGTTGLAAVSIANNKNLEDDKNKTTQGIK